MPLIIVVAGIALLLLLTIKIKLNTFVFVNYCLDCCRHRQWYGFE
ncbi:Uncharacterised protein [Escherichia coli]|uniref:Uncharacterized protein n=1 Tax=Escherichia coli TaxID=562 RepID=A0A376VNV3_ECOLX|nr:Uncharacterised protein [Escherichia coli]